MFVNPKDLFAQPEGPAPWQERRKHERKQCLCAGKLHYGSKVVACNLYDIAPGGARVCVTEYIETEMPVRLVLDRYGEFRGEIVWRGWYSLGIRFLDPSEPVADPA